MNNIKKLRLSMGMTSKELSEKTEIPYDTLKNYEYGRREPSGRYLVALENFFKKTGEYILGLSDDENNCNMYHDKEIMDEIDKGWDTLFRNIILAIKKNDALTQKLVFNIMVEIKYILNSNTMSNYQKSVSISLIHDIVTGLTLSMDSAVVNKENGSPDMERINNYKQRRIKEYTQALDDFFNNFNS